MAFTTEQEEILEKVIEAYENGKRLTDLPDAGEVDPSTLWTEVVGDDGESKKTRLSTFLPYVEDDVAYGIRRNVDDSDPTCTRIGNMDLHRTLPVQSAMRGCLLDDDGNVVQYLPDDDWTGATLDGSKGQVMVEIPMHYRKCQLYDDGTMEVWLSYYPLADYELIPKMYVSAYEAALERSTNKLCSVKNNDPDYRGGNNNAEWDDTDHSLLGVPATNLSMTSMRTYARNRGSAGKNGYGWNIYLYEVHKAITWLFVVEYATLNTQADYTAALTSEGYHQGGLGAGVSTMNNSRYSEWNNYYPFLPCGYTDSIGNGTGVVAYVLPEGYGASLTLQVPRYRGIENPFADCNKFTDGILICVHPDEESGGDGLSPIYTCEDPSKFSSTSYANYAFIGNYPRLNSGSATYVTQVIFGSRGEVMPLVADGSGSSTTFYCDGAYSDTSVTADTIRAVLVGGQANTGAATGFFYSGSQYVPSSTYSLRGSRLCFIPA